MLNLSQYVLQLVIVGVIAGASYGWHRQIVKTEVLAAEHKIEQTFRVQIDEQRKRLTARVITAEDKLNADIKTNRKAKDETIAALNARVKSLSKQLLNRPERPSGVAGDNTADSRETTPKAGATGLQLSRSDAEFLTWFSGFTGELQVELKACIRDYETARKKTKEFNLEQQELLDFLLK